MSTIVRTRDHATYRLLILIARLRLASTSSPERAAASDLATTSRSRSSCSGHLLTLDGAEIGLRVARNIINHLRSTVGAGGNGGGGGEACIVEARHRVLTWRNCRQARSGGSLIAQGRNESASKRGDRLQLEWCLLLLQLRS